MIPDDIRAAAQRLFDDWIRTVYVCDDGERARAEAKQPPEPKAERTYSCDICGKQRTVAQGGPIFTRCDDCWDKPSEMKPPEPKVDALGSGARDVRPVLYWLEDGKFARAMLYGWLDQRQALLLVDLTTGDGPSVVGEPEWFEEGYVATWGGIVPECAEESAEGSKTPGTWSYGVAKLPQFVPKPPEPDRRDDPGGINALRRAVVEAATVFHDARHRLAAAQREAVREANERFGAVVKNILNGAKP